MKVYLLKSQSQQYAHLDPCNGWQVCDEWQYAYFFHSLDTAIQFKYHLHWCGHHISNDVNLDFAIFKVVSRNVG